MSEKPVKGIPLSEVKKLPYKTLTRLINKAREHLKKDEVWKKICQEYKEEPDIIDLIPIRFDDLDVSAKTDHGVIILNYKLLCDGDFTKDYSYLVHEGTHVMQQCWGDRPTQSADDGDYLDNPYEREGFANQVKYIANHESKDEAENYVENLLDHHEINNKTKREELEHVLLKKI